MEHISYQLSHYQCSSVHGLFCAITTRICIGTKLGERCKILKDLSCNFSVQECEIIDTYTLCQDSLPFPLSAYIHAVF